VGAWLGSIISSWVIGKYFILPNGESDWNGIWLSFAAYALIVAILFAIFFKHKHDLVKLTTVHH
jgi:NHS family xanthosine MFS transporter